MKLYERSEDPVYAMENELPLDLEYYVENQLRGPIDRIFEVVFPRYSGNDVFQGKSTLLITSTQQVSKQKGLGMFVSTVYKCKMLSLQASVAPLRSKGPTSRQSATTARTSTSTERPNCTPNTTGSSSRCRRSINTYGLNAKDVSSRLMTGQGTLFDEIICSNNDCPIFYRRKKVIKDIANCAEQLDRFDPGSAQSRKLP